MLGLILMRLIEEYLVLDREEQQPGSPHGDGKAFVQLIRELNKMSLPSWEYLRDALENGLPLPPPPDY